MRSNPAARCATLSSRPPTTEAADRRSRDGRRIARAPWTCTGRRADGYHAAVDGDGGPDAARRFVSLPQGEIRGRIAYALSVHALLLLDLPEDGRWWRLCDQHHGRCRIAARTRPQVHRRLSGPHSRWR